MPWKVLLAMSMMPPVGRATAPTRPLPTPLKKPAAPSFWAPARHDGSERGPLKQLLLPSLEQRRTFDGFGDDAGDSTDEALRREEKSQQGSTTAHQPSVINYRLSIKHMRVYLTSVNK